MAADTLNKDALEKALDIIFAQMQKKGITLSIDAKKSITEKITSHLANKLTLKDVNDVNVQKKLISCITSLAMGKDKEFESTVSLLNEPAKKLMPDATLDKKLLLELTLLKSLEKLILDPDKKKTNDNPLSPKEFFKKMLDAFKSKAKKDGKTNVNEPQVNEIQKQLENTLRNLNGGNNPTMNGEIEFPILGPVFGNLCALTNQTTADPNAVSEMVESITFNAGKHDYMGLENITKLGDIVTGIAPELLEPSQNVSTYQSPSPFNTTMQPK